MVTILSKQGSAGYSTTAHGWHVITDNSCSVVLHPRDAELATSIYQALQAGSLPLALMPTVPAHLEHCQLRRTAAEIELCAANGMPVSAVQAAIVAMAAGDYTLLGDNDAQAAPLALGYTDDGTKYRGWVLVERGQVVDAERGFVGTRGSAVFGAPPGGEVPGIDWYAPVGS